MNRTDRLYAMVEELRAVAPRPRSARWLAQRFEVCARTVERDIGALQESGVPIYAEPGRVGGYVLDKARTLPPVNVTPAEAMAIAVALGRLDDLPFADAARSALQKMVAVMPPADAERADELARRVHLLRRPEAPPPPAVPNVVIEALATGRVLLIDYEDRHGVASTRPVEPMGYVGGINYWYLLAWCRLRDALRAFRLDRIVGATATGEVVTPRPVNPSDIDIPELTVTQVTLTPPENTDRTVSRRHLTLVPSPVTEAGETGGDKICQL